jgi:hypothetical protein
MIDFVVFASLIILTGAVIGVIAGLLIFIYHRFC